MRSKLMKSVSSLVLTALLAASPLAAEAGQRDRPAKPSVQTTSQQQGQPAKSAKAKRPQAKEAGQRAQKEASTKRPPVAKAGEPSPLARPTQAKRSAVALAAQADRRLTPAQAKRPLVAKAGEPSRLARPTQAKRPAVALAAQQSRLSTPAQAKRPLAARIAGQQDRSKSSVLARPRVAQAGQPARPTAMPATMAYSGDYEGYYGQDEPKSFEDRIRDEGFTYEDGEENMQPSGYAYIVYLQYMQDPGSVDYYLDGRVETRPGDPDKWGWYETRRVDTSASCAPAGCAEWENYVYQR